MMKQITNWCLGVDKRKWNHKILGVMTVLLIGLYPIYGIAQTIEFDGGGTFQAVAAQASPWDVALGDFDEDGQLDAVVANAGFNGVSIHLNDDGDLLAGSTIGTGIDARRVKIGDLNHDGHLDFVVGNRGNDMISVHLGDGAGVFATVAPVPATDTDGLALADLNRDGVLDLVSVNVNQGRIEFHQGNGDGSFVGQSPLIISSPIPNPFPIGIAVEDFDRDGILDLAVPERNMNFSMALYKGDGAFGFIFQGRIVPGVAFNPRDPVAHDVNRDGIPDLIVPHHSIGGSPTGPQLSVLIGDGLFGFVHATNSPLTLGIGVRSVGVGDLNGDGNADLAVSNSQSSAVAILEGNGDGTFVASSVPVGSVPLGLALGNLNTGFGDPNRDGKLDLIVTSQNTNSISVRYNTTLFDPSGTFVQAPGSPVTVGGVGPNGIVSNDFNRNGIADLFVTNQGAGLGADSWSILIGDGAGGYTETTLAPVGVGDAPSGVATGDFNRDGLPDAAIANQNSGNLSIVLGDGVGGFVLSSSISTGPARAVATADFNRDGNLDLAVTLASGNVNFHMGSATGAFSGPPNIVVPLGTGASQLAVGDLNQDGRQDLVVTTGSAGDSVAILLDNGIGGYTVSTLNFATGDQPLGVVIEDFDLDGDLDFAVANFGVDTVSVFLGDGSGAFTEEPVSSPYATIAGSSPIRVAAGDLNRDGLPDLAVSNVFGNNATIFFGNGDGTFTAPGSPVSVGPASAGVVVEDLDRDGRLDLAVANRGNSTVSILLNGAVANTAPTANPQTINILEDDPSSPISIALTGSDAETLPGNLSFTIVNTSLNAGSLSGTPPNLIYTPNPNLNGIDSIIFTVTDDDGSNPLTSASAMVTINVVPVNDAPSFTGGPNQGPILGVDGIQVVPVWATNISAGPPNELSQGLDFIVMGNTDPLLFSAQPTVLDNGTLTYTPFARTAGGTATIIIQLMDEGGVANGGVDTSLSYTFTITIIADVDGDGIDDNIDNCPSFNPLQTDSDGDGVGNGCDNCEKMANSDQADADGDLRGDVCDEDINETFDGPPDPSQPGAPIPVTGTFMNNTLDPIQIIMPNCYNNTLFTLTDPNGKRLEHLYNVGRPTIWPDDVITIPAGGEFSVVCDLSKLFDPSVLTSGPNGELIAYEAVATYHQHQQDVTAPTVFAGAVTSTIPQAIQIEGPAVTEESVNVSFTPSEWLLQWGLFNSPAISAQISNLTGGDVDSIDVDSIKLNGGLPILPGSAMANGAGDALLVQFDRSLAVQSLGTILPEETCVAGQTVQVFPTISGDFDETFPNTIFSGQGLVEIECGIVVDIDIQPGTFPNTIDLGEKKGVMPVAILSTADFDATTVDPSTVTFAEAPVKAKKNGNLQFSLKDVNEDGRLDLNMKFFISELNVTVLDTEAELEGLTFDGIPIIGSDAVLVSP